MIYASRIIILDEHHAHSMVPWQVGLQEELFNEQVKTSLRILWALNEAISGSRMGPCRELVVFNDPALADLTAELLDEED